MVTSLIEKYERTDRIQMMDISGYIYRYETHLHTTEGSACGKSSGEEMAAACKEAGYDGIFVTDHSWGGNTAVDRSLPWEEWVSLFAKGYEHAKAWGDSNGLKVWFGYEAGYHGTEFLVYGITPEWLKSHPELHDASIPEHRRIVDEGGGIFVQAHPYREEWYIDEVRLFPEYVDGIEGLNATHTSPLSQAHKSDIWDRQAMELATKYNKPMTAGSDVHSVNIFGGGILTDHPLMSPREYVSMIMGDEMYLMTDGVTVYDRYGNPVGKDETSPVARMEAQD